MKTNFTKKIVALGVAAILSLGLLVGCGSSYGYTTYVDTSYDDGYYGDDDYYEADYYNANPVEDYVHNYCTEYYMGYDDYGEGVYYAGGNVQGLLVFYDSYNNSYASFFGEIYYEQDGTLTIYDQASGMSVNFAVYYDDYYYYLDLGPNGTATIEPCYESEIVDALTALNVYSYSAN